MKVTFIRIGLISIILATWQISISIYPLLEFYIASPWSIMTTLVTSVIRGSYLVDLQVTAGEALAGIGLGVTFGTVIGLTLWLNPTAGRALEPILVALAALPLLAIAPIAVVWLGIGFDMKALVSAFGVFFVAAQSAYVGAKDSYERYAHGLLIKPIVSWRIIQKVVLPGAFAWVLGGIRTSVGVGLLGAFVGEFISSEAGLGHLILRATGLYNMSASLAAAAGIVGLAVCLDFCARFVESRRRWIAQAVSVPRSIWTNRRAPSFDRRVI